MGRPTNSRWTDVRSEQLKTLYAQGLSGAKIAAEMDCGFTRNAIIGRIHRLGLELRGGQPKRLKMEKAPRIQKSRQRYSPESRRVLTIFESAEIIKLRCVEIVSRGLSLMDLEPSDCRYPFGGDDGNSITFCGHPQLKGSSYCAPHFALTRDKPRAEVSEGERQRRRLHFIKLGGNPAREVMA